MTRRQADAIVQAVGLAYSEEGCWTRGNLVDLRNGLENLRGRVGDVGELDAVLRDLDDEIQERTAA